jgi:ABC-type sugar transport system ATPase subunit
MLRVRGLSKSYGETRALAGLDLDAAPGSILGIAGPNGAGKTTFIRIVAGEERPDEGQITFEGKPIEGVRKLEVAVVHQEPQLFPNLTLRENMLVGHEQRRWFRPGSTAAVHSVLRDLGLSAYADLPLAALSLAAQQRAEIARVLIRRGRVFLFDEPNSALTEDESQELFAWMHRLAERGAVVLFITHRLSELVAHAESVVVIRDGRAAARLDGALTQEAVARALVANEHRSPLAVADDAAAERLLVRLERWRSRRGRFNIPALDLYRGEIVAIVGVEGSGGREFVASLAGQERVSGHAELDDETSGSLRGRAEYLPASRRMSLFHHLSIAHNAVSRLGWGEITSKIGTVSSQLVRRRGDSARSRYGIRSRSSDQAVSALSGGNQQKVAMAAIIAREPDLIAVEEPTRGVDLLSRAEIHAVLRDYARRGHLVVAFCTEVSEVFQLADRVYVMDAGTLSDPLYVREYDDAPALAAEIVSLERHATG